MKTCPKCDYVRKSTDQNVPDWQCPSCGIAYAKFEAQTQAPAALRTAVTRAPAPAPMSAMGLFFILFGVVALGWVGYDRLLSPRAKERNVSGGGVVLKSSNPAFYATMEPGGPVFRLKPETAAQLEKITPSRVVMFATSWCPYCAKTREVFSQQGVRYSELDIELNSSGASFQKEVMGVSGVPTIVIGNRVIMGFDEGQILAALKEP